MSLTFVTRLLLFLLLATPAAIAGGHYGPQLADYLSQARVSTAQEARFESRAIVYRLERDRAVSFAFSQPVQLFKLIVHPTVGVADRARTEGFVYGFRARLIDGDGTLLAQHDIHFHAKSPDEVFASGTRWRFFRNRSELIAAQDSIEIASEARVARIELAALPSDRGVSGIDVRVYERRPVLGQQAIGNFRRLSKEEQQALAGANVFPPDMLTADEMNNIALNQWRPVGPVGIAGSDYVMHVVYEGLRPAAEREQGE